MDATLLLRHWLGGILMWENDVKYTRDTYIYIYAFYIYIYDIKSSITRGFHL